MEFSEKLQQLRKERGLTQEQLAQSLYVSRTAVSKWESGRGYPEIESLKAIAAFYGVTVDALLSGQQLLSLAEADSRQKEKRTQDLVFGLLDCSVLLLLFLPFFGQGTAQGIQAVSLLMLSQIAACLRVVYLVSVGAVFLTGLLTLALQNCEKTVWVKRKRQLSVLLSAGSVLVFIVSPQPYAAAFLFLFLIIKVLLLIKWH